MRFAFPTAAMLATAAGICSAQLKTLETTNLRLLWYDPGVEYVVPHVARCFENALAFHMHLFDYVPSEEVTVFLHDFNDYGTGGTSTIPRNFLNIGIEPYDYVYETAPTNERMNWVFNHELAHLVAVDKGTGGDRFYRSLFFGKVLPLTEQPPSMLYSYLTNPRWYSARWYHEGIATFLETWMAGGIGRALGGYDEMVFRTMVLDSSYFYDFVGLESEGTTIDFQIGANSYLYGTRFVSYLGLQYGPEAILEWFNRSEGTGAFYASRFEELYSRSLDDEWGRWIEWERAFQRANLDSIRRYPITPWRGITAEPLGSVSRAFYDSASGKLYCGVNYPGKLAHITEIDIATGEMRDVVDVPTPALYYVSSLAWDPLTRTMFYTTDNSKNWRDIHAVDVGTGSSRDLFMDSRIGDLVFNPADKSLWGVQHHRGISTLMHIPVPYTFWYPALELGYGNDIFDLDISPDGKTMIGVLLEINGRQKLVSIDLDSLAAGSRNHQTLYEFENNSPANFVFSSRGDELYGTSYYTGVSNVFRYRLDSGKVEALTNAESGFFRPISYTADSIIAFRYTGDGFQPVAIPIAPTEDVNPVKYLGQEIVDRHPIVRDWKLAPPNPARINIDSMTTFKGDYDGFGSLGLASIIPVVEGYKNVYALGVSATVADPFPLHHMTFNLSYSPHSGLDPIERVHAAMVYYFQRWEFSLSYNAADFYDLFGPTKTGRKGFAGSVNFKDLIYEQRPVRIDYSLTLAGFADVDALPDYQNVTPTLDQFLSFGGKLTYASLLRTLGAVDVEAGTAAGLTFASKYGLRKYYPRIYATFDYGLILWKHSSLWFRASAGNAFGDRFDTFSNFYFGGFGNNWVDHGSIRRYRDYYAFPGVEINELGGRNFTRLLIEWNLPHLSFRRVGFPMLYANWARLALFGAAVSTNIDDDTYRQKSADAGAQLDIKLVFFSNLESTFSAGYAVAFRPGEFRSDEWMLSLKILR